MTNERTSDVSDVKYCEHTQIQILRLIKSLSTSEWRKYRNGRLWSKYEDRWIKC